MPQQQQNTGAVPQHIQDDLEKNNRGCWYKMTHRYEIQNPFFFYKIVYLKTIHDNKIFKKQFQTLCFGPCVKTFQSTIFFLTFFKNRSEWFCGLSLRTGVFTIAIVQLIVCALGIYGLVKNKDDDSQKKPFALGSISNQIDH